MCEFYEKQKRGLQNNNNITNIILIKAASGDERALAPPRPSGTAVVGENARQSGKHRVQRNKLVKKMVQLH